LNAKQKKLNFTIDMLPKGSKALFEAFAGIGVDD
jgi:hypothetical protein